MKATLRYPAKPVPVPLPLPCARPLPPARWAVLWGAQRRGFTLLEVMIVAAIIGTLAALAFPSYVAFRNKARINAVVADMKSIEKQIYGFNAENGRFPDTLAEAGLDGYTDAWGNPFDYWPITGDKKQKVRKDLSLHPINTDFDLYSKGADGITNFPLTAGASRDDVIRANNGSYFGLAESY